MPSRPPAPTLVLRFRHPKAAPIQSVTLNGQPWNQFKPVQEVIELKGLTGKVAVTARLLIISTTSVTGATRRKNPIAARRASGSTI